MTKRKPVKKIVWTIILLAALGAGSYFGYRYMTEKKADTSAYQEMKAELGEIRLSILSTGVVAPENRLEIKPPVAGRVDSILVNEGDIVVKGQTLAWMSSTERAGLIDSASAKGAEVLKEWETIIKPTPILAPIGGTIIKRNVVAGQTFGLNEAVYAMSDNLTVKAQVDETDIGKITLKQRALITLDAYPDIQTFGHVKKIAFDATTVNNVTSYTVDVTPDSIPAAMRSGMTANVTFELDTKSNILTIPIGAVKVVKGQSFVLLPPKNIETPPDERLITTGITDGRTVEVLTGLKIGEVFLAPQFKLRDANSSTNPFSPMGRPVPRRP